LRTGGAVAEILKVLERYLSSVNARLLLERALGERGLTIEALMSADLPKIGGPLRRGVRLFVKDDRRQQALQDLALLCGSDSVAPGPSSIGLLSETDISTACNQARRICEDVGANSFAMHKVMTIVSELGRNIVTYAGSGEIELMFVKTPHRRIVVRAVDDGPGIPNVQEVLSGRYRSKTGLGKGLIGTKRLADRFDISTGAAGTTIIVEISL
jgi:serine/threonine-protein kinase RsbT